MAALDFPASPTLNQLATLTNGFTYQWDGAVWTLAASTGQQAGGDLTGTYPNPTLVPAQKNLWQTSGSNELAPVDAARSGISVGPGAIKGEFFANSSGDLYAISNSPWAPQDTSKSSWYTVMGSGSEVFAVNRRAGGAATGPGPNLLTLNTTGRLGLGPTQRCVLEDKNGSYGDFTYNQPAYPGYVAANAGWIWRLDAGDLATLYRFAPTTGTLGVPFQINGANSKTTFYPADGTINQASIQAGAVDTYRIAAGSCVHAGDIKGLPVNSTWAGPTGWIAIVSCSAITTRGGPVIIMASPGWRYIGGTTSNAVYIGIQRNGVFVGYQDYLVSGPSGLTAMPLPGMTFLDWYPAAGTYTYTLFLNVSNNAGSVTTADTPGYFAVIEFS